MQTQKILVLLILFLFNSNSFGSTSVGYSIEKYKVKIEPNFKEQSIKGSTEIVLSGASAATIEFPLYGLTIDDVSVNQMPTTFTQEQSRLKIDLSKFKKTETVLVNFHGTPVKGLVWGEGFLYTNYDPCTWMICFEEPSVRVPIEIQLKIPGTMKAVANGNLESNKKDAFNKRTERWVETRPYASYLYGFAIGKFTRVIDKFKSTNLEYLGISQKPEELKKKLKDTEKIIRFFEDKSGVPIPLKKYTQVLIPGSEAQEKNGFSILGSDFVDPILNDPTEDWVIVHELAHQWWGNLLTCKSWNHFWLNEGITVFMTAAYKQQRWGQAAYDREISLAQARYQRAIDAKFDVPLTFSGDYPSMGIKRAITYSKAALFVHELRTQLGDDAFWKGLKFYTMNNQFKSVESKDFQNAMEESAGKSLAPIFNKWVY